MRFLEFRNALKAFPVFSYPDILKVDPAFDRRRLVEWQQQDYIRKIRNGYYIFQDTEINESMLQHLSNNIYKPSYISLDSALAFYNLIPEAVYLITGISTRKTISFETSLGNFGYRNIKEELFFGYDLIQRSNYTIKIASPEKAILDTLYLKLINTLLELEALRINLPIAREIIDKNTLENYLYLYHSRIMEKRVKLFLNFLYAES